MEKSVSAADANRKFSEILRRVREGGSFLVTAHGRPVARIVPVTAGAKTGEGARKVLLSRLRSQKATKAEPWTRDELYEDGV